jgi:N-terminal domain of anti-restriction factor ArdC
MSRRCWRIDGPAQPINGVSAMRVEEIITKRIVKLLEAGTVPWHKPWANRQPGADGMPRNAISKRHYRGINVFILASQPYGSLHWLTFKESDPPRRPYSQGRARHADRLLEIGSAKIPRHRPAKSRNGISRCCATTPCSMPSKRKDVGFRQLPATR